MSACCLKSASRAGKYCGIDIQGNEVVAVKAEKVRGSISFTAIYQADSGSFRGMMVSACVSAREGFTRWLETPFASAGKSLKVLPSLLDIKLPFPVEDCSCLFLDVASDMKTGKTRALAVASRHVDLRKKLDAMAQLGINPHVLDHEGLALWTQSVRERNIGNGRTRAVLYLGTDRATLAVGRQGTYINSHSVNPEDVQQINMLIKVDLESGDSGNAGDDIEIAFAGPRASDPGLTERIAGGIGNAGRSSHFVHDDPKTFLARALAERLLVPGPLRCNLRTGPLAHGDVARREKFRSVKSIIVCITAGLALITAGAVARRFAHRTARSFENELQSVYKEITGGIPANVESGNLIKNARGRLEQDAILQKPFVTAFKPSLAETIVSMTSVAGEKGMDLESLVLTHETVLVTGSSKTWNDCDALSDLLKRLGYAVVPNRSESLADERTVFTISSGEPDE